MKFILKNIALSFLLISSFLYAEKVQIKKAIRVDPSELLVIDESQFSQVFVEIFKVKVNSRGKVTDSILDVRGEDGEAKEFVLLSLNGKLKHAWVTSTAKNYEKREHATRGWIYPSTAEGKGFHPHTLSKDHESSAYNGGKMPFAIFFNGDIALHSTTPNHYAQLGIKDSGACSRLFRRNAETLWNYVNPRGFNYIDSDSERVDVMREIQSRVTINVYGFDDEDRTSAQDRAELKEKYNYARKWIQRSIQQDLRNIRATLKK